jgi:tRNA threonylcarbamoyladenosine biosynthesis protein TsaB
MSVQYAIFVFKKKRMALILNIETATKVCSIALGKDGNLLGYTDINEDEYSHSEKLNIAIVELLKNNNLSFDDLDAVGISSGPGSYTGLRIGTSSAKGFCYGKDIPLISVNTLEELCHLSPIESGIKIPLIDARRMEVFGAVYSHDNKRIQEDFNLVIDEDSFANIEGEKYLFGNGADKLKEALANNTTVHFIDGIVCSARGMITVAEDKFNTNDFEDVAYFEPNYGKEFYTVPSKK